MYIEKTLPHVTIHAPRRAKPIAYNFIAAMNLGSAQPDTFASEVTLYKPFTLKNIFDPMLAHLKPFGEYHFNDGSSAGLSEINGAFYAYSLR